jgi:hypothetical protein
MLLRQPVSLVQPAASVTPPDRQCVRFARAAHTGAGPAQHPTRLARLVPRGPLMTSRVNLAVVAYCVQWALLHQSWAPTAVQCALLVASAAMELAPVAPLAPNAVPVPTVMQPVLTVRRRACRAL